MNTFSNELNIFQKLFTFHLNLTEALYWIMHSRRRREACDCKSICMVYSYLFIIDGFRTRECWVGRIILIDNSNTNTWLYVNSEVQLYPIGKYPIMYVGNCENRSLVVQMKTIHFAKDIDSISMKIRTRRAILTISSPLSWKKYPKPIIWRYHENSGSNKAFIWAPGKN